MSGESPQPTLTPRERAAEQRKQVWNSCQSVLGCGGLIALIALCYFVVGLLPKSVHPGQDVIVFIDARLVRNEIFWCALFGLTFLFGALARVKSTKGAVAVCAVFIVGAGVGIGSLYGQVAAIAFQNGAIELRYVWPRPPTRLNPKDIVSVDWEQGTRLLNDVGIPQYKLHIRTKNRHYASYFDTNFGDIQNAQKRIQLLQAGEFSL